jgi:hypothetical protein
MSRYTFIVGLSALAFATGPAFAQAKPPAPAPKPHHTTHAATTTKKMAKPAVANPDTSADALNGKELTTLQGGAPAPAPMAAPAKKTP